MTRAPRLHVLDLSESCLEAARNSSYGDPWVLVDNGRPSDNDPEQADVWEAVQKYDMLFFPEMLSGAGEFEGVWIVGEATSSGEFTLLSAGIESPEFPQAVLDKFGANLRDRY